MDDKDLRNRFTYHPPSGDQPEQYQGIRDAAYQLADLINREAPDGREKSLSITHLEETVMWANAAIARN